jgi:hypothetical protein
VSAADLLALVPSLLAEAFDQGAVEWRAAVGTGTYATLTGAHQGPTVEAFVFDDSKQREVHVQECLLTVPSSSSEVPAAGQVRTADGLEWGVAARVVNSQHGLMSYTLRRDPLVRLTPDRKATP